MKKTDVQIVATSQHLLPVSMRMPLKFGSEAIDSVTCLRVKVTVQKADGSTFQGWGETPLSVTWAWPSQDLSYDVRYSAMIEFANRVQDDWASKQTGHPMELGHHFISNRLPDLTREFNDQRDEKIPLLATLIIVSAFDIATHDAYGVANQCDVYATYNSEYMNFDLSQYFETSEDRTLFAGKFPSDYFASTPPQSLPVWHLVGGLDPLDTNELSGQEPDDEYPVTLRQWIEADGLTCLKIKLRGNDSQWDYDRLVAIGQMSLELDVAHLSADFNCTVRDPDYVNQILDQLKTKHPEIWDMILYVEQPFPHDLEAHQIDVSSVAARKPLFLDESAHNWQFVKLGRQLGWTGVALKTCKTQTGAILSLCWAREHDMPLMVQDLTNPMLAQIPHVRLAAHAETIMGVESNGMQFYPAASIPEQKVHPGIYQRRNGELDLSSIQGFGFGYRIDEIDRKLD